MNKKIILLASGVVAIAIVAAGVIFYFNSGKNDRNPLPQKETPEPTVSPNFSQTTPTPSLDPQKYACPDSWIGLSDQDKDGLPDITEELYKTNQTIADTDGDGYQDGAEVRNGYDPLISIGNPRLDSDQDEYFENDECKIKSDPFNRDTDGDGYEDGVEVKNGYHPLIAGSAKLTSTPWPTEPTNYLDIDPTIDATPTPTLPAATPTATPVANAQGWQLIGANEIKKIPGNSKTDIRAYLASIDSISPQGITLDLPTALLAAFQGSPDKLRAIVTKLKQHENKLLQVSVPPSAVEHHILFVSLVRYVNAQLIKIADLAGKNPEQQRFEAVQLQNKLSETLKKITALKEKLATLSQ